MKPATILLVDDDVALAKTVKMLLEHRGFHVFSASDGAQALALLAQRPADLILLDINMPTLSGETMILKLRNHPTWRQIPVIMLTGLEDARHQHLAANLGAVAYLRKPCPPDELLHAIHQALAPSTTDERNHCAQ